jgi:hypothetical protein
MDGKRKYKEGYKPKLCLVDLTLQLENIKSRRKKEVDVKKILITLDDNNGFPTERMENLTIDKAWRLSNLGKIEDFKIGIKNLKIISEHGRINYKFDESIH